MADDSSGSFRLGVNYSNDLLKDAKQRLFSDQNGDIWKETYCQDGTYFYNVKNRQTLWELPDNFVEIAPWQAVTAPNLAYNKVSAKLGVTSDYGYGTETQVENSGYNILKSTPVPNTDWTINFLEDGRKFYTNSKLLTSVWDEPEELKFFSIEKYKKGRPITAEPIKGTTWYAVLTEDGKIFFYNHVTSISHWERPDELEGNSTVDSVLEKLEFQSKLIIMNRSSDNSFKTILKHKINFENDNSSEEEPEPPLKVEKISETICARANSVQNLCSQTDYTNKKSIDHAELDQYLSLSHSERAAQFLSLLKEKNVSAFASYESEVQKLEGDPRFHLLQTKERKTLFNEYLQNRVEQEKAEKHAEIHKRYKIFNDFLKTVYSEIFSKYSNDARFRSIPKEKERENLFNIFIKEFNIDVAESNEDENKKKFFEMLIELSDIDSHTPWRRVKKRIRDDTRYAIVAEHFREVWFDQFIEKKVAKEKEESQNRACEKEKERKAFLEKKKIENLSSRKRIDALKGHAIVEFKSLLTDTIRDSSVSWSDAQRVLRNDHRWGLSDILSRNERLELFDDHISILYQKIIKGYRKLLDEVGVSLTSKWEDIYQKIRKDSRCLQFSKHERTCKNEFYSYIDDKNISARKDFLELLSETKMLDYRFLARAKLVPSLYDDLYEILGKDSRFHILDHIEDERRQMIDKYLSELEKKGSSLPPTSTAPHKRTL